MKEEHMNCPHCRHKLTIEELKAKLSPDDLKSLWAAHTSSLRVTFGAGPGRPRTAKRCACGAMTKARAKQRNHKCPPEAGKQAA